MSNFKICPICDEYDFIERHVCKPLWNVIIPDWNDDTDPDDWYKAYGIDEKMALDSLCIKKFSDWDYPEELEMWIKKPEETEWKKYDMTMEPVPQFSFNEK